jgi:CheY-like chemotaxis protein
VTIARTVSETFFFAFSHSTCSGVSHTLIRSVLRSATPASAFSRSGETPDRCGRDARTPVVLLAGFMLPVAAPKILVVEDDDTVRRLLAEHLAEHMHVDVDSARDGVEALHKTSTHDYRIIILDVMMPKMSGVDFLDSLRALTEDPSVKAMEKAPAVVIITAAAPAALSDSVIHKRSPGAVRAIFRKPLDVAALADCVKELLRYDPARR